MATSNTKRTQSVIPDLDAMSERVKETNQRWVDASRKLTNAYLDGVDSYVTGFAKAERKFGAQSPVSAFGELLNVHADLTEDVFKASVAATRELISA
ncbi:MAG TPA: hypothetical protein VMD09_05555 [Solirubrobacteraceae bacterium]|nr:hypothetical protein [Solirubrobacteraceae bacterium]